jgi:hypothetical protein
MVTPCLCHRCEYALTNVPAHHPALLREEGEREEERKRKREGRGGEETRQDLTGKERK